MTKLSAWKWPHPFVLTVTWCIRIDLKLKNFQKVFQKVNEIHGGEVHAGGKLVPGIVWRGSHLSSLQELQVFRQFYIMQQSFQNKLAAAGTLAGWTTSMSGYFLSIFTLHSKPVILSCISNVNHWQKKNS